ncbi:MAG: rhomboid family intramembrane serine protease, partial [Dehalococcoidia bacterium]|nr:rhomboid family intramembrane serine protease [Dehalococcoidia bacterium]
IGTNAVLFLASLVVLTIINSYGLVPADVLSRPWTILTAMFLHASWGHITGNMLTLYFFGSALIEIQGGNRFLIVYLVGGIAGNLLYALIGQPYSIAIGASGAIFALGGALVALIPSQKVLVFPIPVQVPLWLAVVGGFIVVSFWPGVAWQAHLGGIVAGLALGLLYRQRRYSRA